METERGRWNVRYAHARVQYYIGVRTRSRCNNIITLSCTYAYTYVNMFARDMCSFFFRTRCVVGVGLNKNDFVNS